METDLIGRLTINESSAMTPMNKELIRGEIEDARKRLADALETKNMSQAIVYLALTAVGVGTIFLYFCAIYSSMFEYLIYGGVLIILFMAAAAFSGKEEKPDKEATK